MWPENLQAVHLFVSLQTQWRIVAGFAAVYYLGIDYGAAGELMRARRLKNRAQLYEDLQLMEAAALPIRNAKPHE